MSAGSLRRTTLGKYRLADFVGAGGMGEVYRAVDVRTGRVVALKVLMSASHGSDPSARFRDEARIHAAMKHPGIAELHEFFEADGLPCIAMEFVDGRTIEELLRQRHPLVLSDAMRIFAGIVDAVGYLHQRGVIHRDIKSNNVKLTEAGQIKLLDFGIAKSAESPKLTATGNVVGTLQYLSPEQLRTGVAEQRSDLWSLGVLLFELMTGRMPFEGEGIGALTERILKGTYRAPSSLVSGLPREVDRIVGRCLTVAIDGRYATAEALLTDVRTFLSHEAPRPVGSGKSASPLERRSGELLLAARKRGPLLASMTAAMLALVFLVSTLLSSPPRRVTPGGDSLATARTVGGSESANTKSGPAAALGPTESEGSHRVLLDVFEGSAEVEVAGHLAGPTPYPLAARLHDSVVVTLRQRGYADTTVMVEFTENRHAHTVKMRALLNPNGENRPQSPQS